MTLAELELSNRMRALQKKFENTRNSLYQMEMRKAEREFDELLSRLNAHRVGNNNSQQALEFSR